jgi:hypothetical protein
VPGTEIDHHADHWWRACGEYCQHTSHHHDNKLFKVSIHPTKVPITFAIGIHYDLNKVQGQTMKTIGIYLPELVFTHGQLYVTLSRATRVNDVSVFCPNGRMMTNVLYTELLQ